MEEYAIILDYLPLGYVKGDLSSFKKKPIAQALGTDEFTLLELIPKKGVELNIHDKVYIGPEKRDEIYRVNGKLPFDNLTATSRVELPFIIEEIIKSNEEKYIKFFNEASPINARLHRLELLPGVGKTHRQTILETREKEPFKDFADLKERVPLLKDPVTSVSKRVMIELDTNVERKGKNKYKLFTPNPQMRNREHNNDNRRRSRPRRPRRDY